MIDPKYLAKPEDGGEILRILESSSSQGNLELLYTRRPDAYESYQKEWGETRVFVSRKDDRMIGTCAEIIRDVYINEITSKAAYVCGLKKDADYDGFIGFGMNFIRSLQRDDIDFYYCSVLSENDHALQVFGNGSRLISFQPISTYTTYILKPKRFPKKLPITDTFHRATEADREELEAFLRCEGSRKDLFPKIDYIESVHGLHVDDFYCLRKDGKIVATAALWNQTDYKQYVVKRYGGVMKLMRLLNALISALGYIRLPKEDQPLVFPMVSFFLCKEDSSELGIRFMEQLEACIRERYPMYVIGLGRDHFATPYFQKRKSIHFDTKFLEIRFPWDCWQI